jgi:hypothetical protein
MIAHIVHIVRQLKSKDIKILVCAHSNAAVDRGEQNGMDF